MNCGFCEHTDGLIYTSNPPKVKCNFTGEYHDTRDDCNVELAPVKHGRWIDCGTAVQGDTEVKCSECGEVLYWLANYCPNCGARMNGEEDEKNSR